MKTATNRYIMPQSAQQPQSVLEVEETTPETVVRPKRTRKTKSDQRAKRQPRYAVILHNDDLNTMDFVVHSLQKVFGYNSQVALDLMARAHIEGRSQVWSGTRELAELKAEQLVACGPDPTMAMYGALPLKVSVEPITEE